MAPRWLPVVLTLLTLSAPLSGCLGNEANVTPEPASHDARMDRLPAAGLKVDNLSERSHDILAMFTQKVDMALDGIRLHAEVYLPSGDGPWPTILEMSPYHATRQNGDLEATPLYDGTQLVQTYVPLGYAVVLAHVRGTGNSEGCMDMMGDAERSDGHDMVEWIAAQDWSDGKVGMHGVSYVGTTPHLAAVAAPDHLVTIVTIAGVTNQWRNTFQNGVPYLGRQYPLTYNAFSAQPPTDVTNQPAWLFNAADAACGQEDAVDAMRPANYAKGVYTSYWEQRDSTRLVDQVNASILYSQGFVDRAVNPSEALGWFNEIDAPKKAFFHQAGHRYPPRDDYFTTEQAWFDHWLKGRDTGVMDTPVVEVQLNTDELRVDTEWPPAADRTTNLTWHLAPGRLEPTAPDAAEQRYAGEPQDLAFTDNGPTRQSALPSELRFFTDRFAEEVHLAGAPVMDLLASSDAAYTYYTFDLYDVDEHDETTWIAEGWFNAHLRSGRETSDPLTPGEAARMTFPFEPREYIIEAGHKLFLHVVAVHPDVVPFDEMYTERTLYYGADGSTLTLPVLDEPRLYEAPEAVTG